MAVCSSASVTLCSSSTLSPLDHPPLPHPRPPHLLSLSQAPLRPRTTRSCQTRPAASCRWRFAPAASSSAHRSSSRTLPLAGCSKRLCRPALPSCRQSSGSEPGMYFNNRNICMIFGFVFSFGFTDSNSRHLSESLAWCSACWAISFLRVFYIYYRTCKTKHVKFTMNVIQQL